MFREIVRKKQALKNDECIKILKEQKRGVLAVLGDDEYPYTVPINHYYNEEDGALYFHSGKTGHKIDAIKKGAPVIKKSGLKLHIFRYNHVKNHRLASAKSVILCLVLTKNILILSALQFLLSYFCSDK